MSWAVSVCLLEAGTAKPNAGRKEAPGCPALEGRDKTSAGLPLQPPGTPALDAAFLARVLGPHTPQTSCLPDPPAAGRGSELKVNAREGREGRPFSRTQRGRTGPNSTQSGHTVCRVYTADPATLPRSGSAGQRVPLREVEKIGPRAKGTGTGCDIMRAGGVGCGRGLALPRYTKARTAPGSISHSGSRFCLKTFQTPGETTPPLALGHKSKCPGLAPLRWSAVIGAGAPPVQGRRGARRQSTSQLHPPSLGRTKPPPIHCPQQPASEPRRTSARGRPRWRWSCRPSAGEGCWHSGQSSFNQEVGFRNDKAVLLRHQPSGL